MARTSTFELSETLQIIQGNGQLAQGFILPVYRLHTSEVQNGIQQGGGMSGGENESVTIGPDWVGGIKSEKLLPQHVNDWRHSHRSPWMTGVRLLDSIDAKRPDCVYREGFNIRHTPQHKNDSGVDQIELIVSRVPYLVYRLVSCLSCNSPCANSAHRRISPFFSTTVSKRCCWWPVC